MTVFRAAAPVLTAVAIVAGAALASGRPAWAGGNLEAGTNCTMQGCFNLTDAAWDLRAIPITWKMNNQGVIDNCNNGNPACVGGVSPLTLQRAIDAMTAAFDQWQTIPTSRIAFSYAGTTAQTNVGLDNVRLITWADTSSGVCGTGVVASTPSSRLNANLTVSDTNRDLNNDGIIDLDPAIYPNGTFLKAGTIVDADMIWCPGESDYVDAPLDTTTNTFDMVAVGTHENGHFHGLAHSSLIQPIATMLPFVDNKAAYATEVRSASQDDIASCSRYYPEATFATSFGSITGRLFFPGSTTPAEGASVTAFNKATGEMAVQVFSVSRFTNTTNAAGSFRIDGLPPGDYYVGIEYFDSRVGQGNTAGDLDWWDWNRYNLTILNNNLAAAGLYPRPEFYSLPENSTDDLADQVAVSVGAGATVNVGSIVINTDAPPTPSGATHLNLANGTSVQVTFPAGFSFPFFGRQWTSAFANDNGNLTFGAGDTFAFSQNFLGPDAQTLLPVPPRIAFPLGNLDPSWDNSHQGAGGPTDAFSRFVSDAQGDRMEFIYLGVPLFAAVFNQNGGSDPVDSHKSCTAIVRLFRTGRIEIQYKFWSSFWGVVGISPGGDGTEPAVEIDITRQLPFSGSAGQAIFEHFEFAQPASVGGTDSLKDALDVNGSLLVFTPNAQGGYDLTSPNFAVLPPGEIQGLRFADATTLTWDTRPEAVTYNLYRGSLGSLLDSNADGAAESYGSCLDAGLPTPSAVDATAPSSGAGFFFLATGRNQGGEGTLGRASSGAARPNTSPCL